MPPSLLSLSNELLARVVDQIAAPFVARQYSERQGTLRALALVNKRIGALARTKLLEAVHLPFVSPLILHGHKATRAAARSGVVVRTLSLWHDDGLVTPLPRQLHPAFRSIRRLHIIDGFLLGLGVIMELQELEELALAWVALYDSPLRSRSLRRLSIYACSQMRTPRNRPTLVAPAGCPSLRHSQLTRLRRHEDTGAITYSHDLVAQLDTLVIELIDDMRTVAPLEEPGVNDATLDKTLFDRAAPHFPTLEDDWPGARHVRVFRDGEGARSILDEPEYWDSLARRLSTHLPDLETIYLPVELDPARVMHVRDMADALALLVANCTARGVEVIWHDDPPIEEGDDRRSPQFEARCRRIKAERAAAASATTSGARAAG